MRRCPLPEPRTPRKPGYLDRLLETSPARRTAAVRAPHQIRWAPGSAPGAGTEPEPPDGPAGRAQRQARGCADRIRPSRPGSGQAATAPCRARRPPATAGQRSPRDRSRRGRPGRTRDQAEGAAVRSGAAPGRLAAASSRADRPSPGPEGPASDATRQAGSPQSRPAVTREDRRTPPLGAPSVHIGSVEVRLTAPVPPAAPPRPPAPAVARLSRPWTPFGLGQV